MAADNFPRIDVNKVDTNRWQLCPSFLMRKHLQSSVDNSNRNRLLPDDSIMAATISMISAVEQGQVGLHTTDNSGRGGVVKLIQAVTGS